MLTIQEFATKVGRSVPTIRNWVRDGLLEKRKFSGSLQFTEKDILVGEEIKKTLTARRVEAMKWGKNAKKN